MYFLLLPSPPLREQRYCDARCHAVTLCVCLCSILGGESDALLLLFLQPEENAQSAMARTAIERLRSTDLFDNVLFACFVKKV